MKKLCALVLSVCLLLSIVPAVSADVAFKDFGSSHWAYNYVSKLVADGTINGFEDGTFKPEDVVTRAQFVKMIGKGDASLGTAEFDDVPKNFWAYDYIVSSGLEAVSDRKFMPNEGITRNDVAKLLWKRNGQVTGLTVPYVITSQGTNSDAVAFVYTYGIMNGDDGVDLRLSSTLTRAEAAAIIVRAREINASTPKKEFTDIIQDGLLEKTFDSITLFGVNDKYEPDRKITNGELAAAALRIGLDEYTLTYKGMSVSKPFEHKYAKEISVLGRYLFGDSVVNAEFANKNATIKDTISALTYFTFYKTSAPLLYGEKNNYYSGILSVRTDIENIMLTFAKTHGITTSVTGMDVNREVTMKDFMNILLQLDGMMGTGSYYKIKSDLTNKKVDMKLVKNLTAYPQNADKYKYISQEVPTRVYDAPFLNLAGSENIEGNPKNDFAFAREYKSIFIDMLQRYSENILSVSGVNAELWYYPSMTFYNGNGYTLRMKVKIQNAPAGKKLSSVFGIREGVTDFELVSGQEFYADFETGVQIIDIVVPIKNIKISQVIY